VIVTPAATCRVTRRSFQRFAGPGNWPTLVAGGNCLALVGITVAGAPALSAAARAATVTAVNVKLVGVREVGR
jgi:hypothetical protein